MSEVCILQYSEIFFKGTKETNPRMEVLILKGEGINGESKKFRRD
jgi:hypothetical protein